MIRLLKKVILPVLLLVNLISSAQSTMTRSERSKTRIANMKLARDPHSYSLPNEARVTHLNWNAKVNFDSKTIEASATYTVENLTNTNVLILDIKNLKIESVEVDNVPADFGVEEGNEFLGGSLKISIQEGSKYVTVNYRTTEGADALLWVDGASPFLFTQSQAILARTWIPCQDSPGVRITYEATVEVPKGLLALMSAENPQQKNDTGIYTFKMDQPVPSYLIALAVGNIEFRSLGTNTGVYASPDLIEKAAYEFEDMQKMVDAAQKLYGEYIWGRYDLLILPAAFPFGGMENPKLTFATPTIIAGDKSLVSLVAHELAHSWSGNLVTNTTWDDFWLNEGFTVYFEQRIMEMVFGRPVAEMQATLARQDLDATVAEISKSEHPEDTRLKLSLEGRNPDDGMTDIAYNKGYFFLRLIEETAGRDRFDAFLMKYFDENAFQGMDTEKFITYLRANLVDAEMEKKIRIDEWVYSPGLPSNIPMVNSAELDEVDQILEYLRIGKLEADGVSLANWNYQQQYRFISNLPVSFSAGDMAILDKNFHLTETGNNEVLFAWLEQSIRRRYEAAYPQLENFLIHVGRRKFVAPLFEEMVKTNQQDMAAKIYEKARPGYHAVTVGTVDEMLGWKK